MSGTTTGYTFTGFSTLNAVLNPNTTLHDVALVNVDLYYAFNTRVGERVMRPEWGCAIWDYFMEPMTPFLNEQIIAEATRICQLDPRLTVQNVNVFELQNGIRVEITLLYAELNILSSFFVNFENSETARVSGITS